MQKSEKWATSPIISLIQLKDENRMRFHRQEKEARVFFMENAWIESDCFSGGHVTNRIPFGKSIQDSALMEAMCSVKNWGVKFTPRFALRFARMEIRNLCKGGRVMFEEQLPLLSTPTKFSSIYIELSI